MPHQWPPTWKLKYSWHSNTLDHEAQQGHGQRNSWCYAYGHQIFRKSMLKNHRKFCRRGLTHRDATSTFKNRQRLMRHTVVTLLQVYEISSNCGPTNLYVYQLEYCSWCWDTWDVLFQLASLWWWQAYCCGINPAFPIYKGSIYARGTSLRSQRGFGCDSDWSKTIKVS